MFYKTVRSIIHGQKFKRKCLQLSSISVLVLIYIFMFKGVLLLRVPCVRLYTDGRREYVKAYVNGRGHLHIRGKEGRRGDICIIKFPTEVSIGGIVDATDYALFSIEDLRSSQYGVVYGEDKEDDVDYHYSENYISASFTDYSNRSITINWVQPLLFLLASVCLTFWHILRKLVKWNRERILNRTTRMNGEQRNEAST